MSTYLLQRFYRAINNRALRLAMYKTASAIGMRTMTVRFDINNYCNIRCVICITRYRENPPRQVMILEDFRKIAADIFPKTRALYLSCGYEPLAVKNFPKYLAVAADYKIPHLSFATNAMLLTEPMCKAIIAAKVNEIVISADGATAETYEFIRTGAKFSRLLENLTRLKKMKQEAGTAASTIRMNFTYMDKNVGEILDFINIFSDLGMTMLELRPMLVEDPSIEELFTNRAKTEIRRLMPEIEKRCADKQIGLMAPLAYETAGEQPGGQSGGNFKSGTNTCILPYLCAYVDAHGDYRPCPGGPKGLGNLIKQSHQEILKSDPISGFIKQSKKRNPICEACNFS